MWEHFNPDGSLCFKLRGFGTFAISLEASRQSRAVLVRVVMQFAYIRSKGHIPGIPFLMAVDLEEKLIIIAFIDGEGLPNLMTFSEYALFRAQLHKWIKPTFPTLDTIRQRFAKPIPA